MTDQPTVNIPQLQLGQVSSTFIHPCLDCGTTVQVKDAREQPHEHRVFHKDDSPLAYAWWEGYDAARGPVLEKLQFARDVLNGNDPIPVAFAKLQRILASS